MRKDDYNYRAGLIPLTIGVAIVLAALLGGPLIMGATYQKKIREYFAGSVLDSGRVVLWTGADSTGSYRLTLAADSTAIDSVIDSIGLSDTAISFLTYKFYFFGQDVEAPDERTIPPMFPRVSGGAVDSNRTEQGGAGSGTYTVNIKFLDTSTAPDAFIPNVDVDLRGWNTSTLLGTATTSPSGVATFGTDADSVAFRGVGPSAQYVWPINWEDSVAGSGNLTDTVMGFFIDVPVASGSKVCAVTVIVLDNGGRPARNVPVHAYLPKSNLRDSAGYAVANYMQQQKTDTLGRATFQCRWSSYLIPATKWWFAVAAPGVGMTRINKTVPRQASYTLQF